MERVGTEEEVLNGAWLADQIRTKHPDAHRELARARLVLLTRVKAMADVRVRIDDEPELIGVWLSTYAEFLEARSAISSILLGVFDLEMAGEDSEQSRKEPM